MLAISDPANPRDEDHFGHKVEWENDIELEFRGAGSAIFTVTCDVLTKLHQGTHSKDAFTNNVHELVYHLRCDDGPGSGSRCSPPSGGRASSSVPATARSTSTPARRPRRIPPRAAGSEPSPTGPASSSICWCPRARAPTSARCTRPGRRRTWSAARTVTCWRHFNPYFQVRLPSRFHDPALAPVVGRPIDVCYEVTGTGERASGGPCDRSTDEGLTTGVTFDDPRSEFNGAGHFVDINANNIANADGPDVWYTDAYGRNGRTEPFPGSIRQRIASVDNDIGVDVNGPTIGQNRNYSGGGVRAPN